MDTSKYGTAYRAIRKAWSPVVARGEAACHEPICLMPTRAIAPGSKWDLSHDPTGTVILGPSHRSCVTDPKGPQEETPREPAASSNSDRSQFFRMSHHDDPAVKVLSPGGCCVA